MPFRTQKISDPTYPADHLQFITIKTARLQGRGDICVFVPPGESNTDLPLCILLHGVYGSSWSWALNAGAHLTALNLMRVGKIRPMILAMPSDGLWGDGSGYLAHSGRDFEGWITEDVPTAVGEMIPQAASSTISFIHGLSMGGFGALRIGAKYPEKFQAIGGHSSITSLDQMKLFVEESLDVYTQMDSKDQDVFLWMQQNKDRLPPIRFDCGTDDLLISYNRQLHQNLLGAGILHEYEEFPGSHEWAYWAAHLGEMLIFFDQQY
ncbi:MAG: alpha/beta hydrolase-fold protein [Bacteroidota bacterium]